MARWGRLLLGDDEDGSVRSPATTSTTTADRRTEAKSERASWARVRRADAEYGRRLRDIARQIEALFRGVWDPEHPDPERFAGVMDDYAEMIRPWAENQGARMLADVSRRDEGVWTTLGRQMGRALREEIRSAPTGEVLRGLLAEQVRLITSLPLVAAERVHQLTTEALADGTRAREIAAEIMRTGEVTLGRATLIARTEVTRSASALVQARAAYVGSEGYVWRTADDSDVRPQHRRLAGRFVRWDSPPVAGSRGERAHAGMIYNCRCYPEPVIPEFRAEAA